MKALRWSCPWQGSGLLLGLLLWSLLPSPTASQDRATQLPTLQTASPDPQGRIASSVRTAAKIVSENGMATARARMGRGMRWDSSGAPEVYIHATPLTAATLAALRQHGVRVLRSDAQ